MIFSEIRHQVEMTGTYLGTPSMVRMPNGTLVVSHDYFGAAAADNRPGLTSIYHSYNNGKDWVSITHLVNMYWGTLFLHRGSLYLFGVTREYGDLVIRRSTDGGLTWTYPTDSRSGLLRKAGEGYTMPNYTTGVCAKIIRNGRLMIPADLLYADGTAPVYRPDRESAMIFAVPEDADLLDAANWSESNALPFERTKVPDQKLPVETSGLLEGRLKHADPVLQVSGWLEGNLIEAPDGSLKYMTRIHLAQPNKAAILDVSDDGSRLSFDYASGIIDFPGGHSRFIPRKDPVTGLYFTLTNYVDNPDYFCERHELDLAVSEDLRNWRMIKQILKDDTGMSEFFSAHLTGFQYVDWLFDGDDIEFVCRTGYRGAHTFHDSNRITYHRIPGFRKLLS